MILEETIRGVNDAVSVHEAEVIKWLRECEMYEERILLLRRDQNCFLKELMGKMNFDMDINQWLREGDTADENEDKTEGEHELFKWVRVYLLFLEYT